MNIKALFLASAGLLAFSTTAQAAYYVGADVGLAVPIDEKLNECGYKTEFKMDNGFVGDIVAGYDFGNNIRTELDFGYRRYSMDELGGVKVGGRMTSYALTANVFYDFNNSTAITPFIGVGAGIARNKLEIRDVAGKESDTSTKFAMLGTAGISYDITDNVKASLAYRYFTSLNQDFNDAQYDLISHEILFGLRYEFGACKQAAETVSTPKEETKPVVAAAAPSVAAAAAASETDKYAISPENVWNAYTPIDGAKEYTLYFRNNSDFISDSDKKILAEVVNEYKNYGNVKIKIDGAADALGTQKYNKKLSQRRALATEKALVEMGVDAAEILTHGEGIIGTKPNPKNRRVDIVFAK